MSSTPVQITLEITPHQRFDIIDVTERVQEEFGDILQRYAKAVYCSLHTTAGYLEQSLSARLLHSRNHVDPFIRAFRNLFPPDANYRHDQLELRTELSEEQRKVEPKNADSHLIFISSGLRNCVTYKNKPDQPVYFIDLDGVNGESARRRKTSILAYNEEKEVHRVRMPISMSGHQVDSINLKDPRIGFMDELHTYLDRFGVEKGKIDISLAVDEKNAGLTVNEYETLLMRYDLIEVLRNPLRFAAMQGKHMLLDPRAIPSKTLNYAKYDLVHVFNELMDAFRVSSSVVEKILSKFIAVPAERFLRMKKGVSLLVSNEDNNGKSRIVQGTYQSPILVQWQPTESQTRYLDVVITKFD